MGDQALVNVRSHSVRRVGRGADPTCARRGVLRGQIDISARVIWIFEKLGWVSDVRWTNSERLVRITARKGPRRAQRCPDRGEAP